MAIDPEHLEPSIVDRYKDAGANCLFFGIRCGDMTRQELLTTIGWLAADISRLHDQYSSDLAFLTTANQHRRKQK